MTEQVKQDAQVSELPDLTKLLSDFPDSPDQNLVEQWKQEFGEVFCSGFADDELFVWRPLSRGEYVDIQKTLRTPPGEGQEPMNEYDMEELVVSKCVLWGSKPSCLQRKAGAISTISEQVMMNSNFMPTQMAAALVIKL